MPTSSVYTTEKQSNIYIENTDAETCVVSACHDNFVKIQQKRTMLPCLFLLTSWEPKWKTFYYTSSIFLLNFCLLK